MYTSPQATKEMDLDLMMAPQKPDFNQDSVISCFNADKIQEYAPIQNSVKAFSIFGDDAANSDQVLRNI